MAESISSSIDNNNPQKLQKEDIKDLLNKFEKSGNSDDFDIDGNSEISEKEIEIKKQLSQIQDKVGFLKWLLAKIEQKQNISKQNTNTESKETNTSLLNKELKDYTPEEAKTGLKYLQDNYQSYEKILKVDGDIGSNDNINGIKDRQDAHLFQKELIKIIDPGLSKYPFVTDTHISTFNDEKGEYIISAEELKNGLGEGDINSKSYLEVMRYLKWVEKVEGNNTLTRHLADVLDYILNPQNYKENEYKNEVNILKKHLPKNFLENENLNKFANDFNVKIDKYNIRRAYANENNDDTNEGELELIINNLKTNLGEEKTKKLMQLCVKSGYTRDETIEVLGKYSHSLKSELKAYKEEHKKYYEAKEKKEEIEKNQKVDKVNTQAESSNDYYTKTNNGYQIKAPNGENITISEKEKNSTIGRPNALKNLINFYTFFKDLNLLGVWEYREDLMLAVGDMNINPNDDDSIKEEELRKFGNKLLTFISNAENKGKGKKFDLQNLDSVNSELRKFSGSNSMFSDSQTYNIHGEDKFTAYLRSQGIIGGAYFKINKFREILG